MTTTKALVALCLCAATLSAQTPKDPPPWWGIADDDTVSLHWNFDLVANPLVPTVQIVPSWYVPPLPTHFTNSPNITWLPALAGQVGVLGFTGPGTGTIQVLIDNDPRPYWIKVFFVQFDAFAAGASTIVSAIQKDLAKYERGILSEETEALPNGWVRVTLQAYLIPQPIDEKIDLTLTEAALNSVAIDNLFVNSRCVKPPPDEKGTALGEKDSASLNVNLNAATGITTCTAVCATEDSLGALTYWVAGRNTATGDQIVRLNSTGTVVGAPTPLPNPVPSLQGASDLAVSKVRQSPVLVRTFVHGVLDRRPANGTVAIVTLDADTPVPVIVPGQNIVVAGFPPSPGPLGLAYSPHGDLGAGTFWISDQLGNVREVSRAGVILRTLTSLQNGTPQGISGASYDPYTGLFYWFSDAVTPTPQGPVQIAGFVHSGYSMQPTGIQWFGDLDLPNPGGPRGGVAKGLELLRKANGDLRLLCTQETQLGTFLVVLKGPYQFGWSLEGRCGMRNGPPMEGNPGWQVTLSGVPHAVFAILVFGFSNTITGTTPLPAHLGGLGFDETRLSVSPDLTSPILPVVNGSCAYAPGLLPPGSGLHYLPLYFQWAVFDAGVPLGITGSQAGETVIY